jgi:Zn-dependent peptidase ImmA (M78 family)/DNA-binding XRE family transcriptional regulator
MTNLLKFQGERLKSARQYRGMTLTELAAATDISKQSLSLYENNKNKPELKNVLLLSRALDFPLEFFSSEGFYQVKTEATYFRSLLSATKKDRTAQSIKLEYIAQIYETLFERVVFPRLNLPDISFNGGNEDYAYENDTEVAELEEIAQQVRDFWGLGLEPIKDLQYVLESNGIIITSFDANADKIDAFSQRTIVNGEEVFFIVVSKKGQSIARARFDMAHELAHILLHPWSEDLESITKEEFKARERQANIFASAFLLPKESFSIDVAHYPTNLEYYRHLKKKWNVSIQAMVYRAHQLDIITSNQYQYLMRQISKNGWKTKEPEDKPYNLTSNLLQSALILLIQNKQLTGAEFVDVLKSRGIVMYPKEIEELLGLKKGTLEPQVTKKPVLIQLKQQDDES